MNDFFRRTRYLAAPLILSASLTACNSGGDDPAPVSSGTSSVSITGVVAKGVAEGVTVTAYKLNVNGTKGAAVGTGTTNSDGSYSITLDSSYTGGPIKVEVTHAAGATMKCDLAAGCGLDASNNNIPFGGTYTLSSDFSLSTVTSNLSNSDRVNVTAITTVATKVLEKKLENLGSGEGTAATSTQIAITNSEIADLFGISTADGGDLTRVPLIDITDPAATKSASANALKYAAIGPAIVGAVKSEGGNTDTIEQAITRFANDNSDGTIKGETSDPGVTDLKEVLEATKTVITAAEDADQSTTIDNKLAVDTQIDTEVNDAETVGDNDTQGTASDTVLNNITDDIATAKVAMGQIRELGRVSFMDALDAENNNAGSATAFQTQLSAAEGMADSVYVIEATAMAIDAIARKVDEDSQDQVVLDDNENVISVSQEGDTYTVVQTIFVSDENDFGEIVTKGVAVNMTGTYVSTITDTETESQDGLTYNGSTIGAVNLSLTGSAVSAETTLTINDGTSGAGSISAVEYEHDADWNVAQENGSDTGESRFDGSITGAKLKLDLTLLHEDTSNGNTSFEGVISIDLDNAVLDVDETETLTHTQTDPVADDNFNVSNTTTNTEIDNERSIARLGILGIGLEGKFKHGTDSFNAVLGVAVNGGNRILTNECVETEINSETVTYVYEDQNALDQGFISDVYFDSNNSGSPSQECNDNLDSTMIDVTIAMGFDVDLNGTEEVARVFLTGQRDGLEGFNADFNVKYPGVELNFDLDTENLNSDVSTGTLTVTNLDGVKFVMTGAIDSTVPDGTEDTTINNGTVSVVTGDNEQFVGDLIHNDTTNITTAYFVDGSFETIQ